MQAFERPSSLKMAKKLLQPIRRLVCFYARVEFYEKLLVCMVVATGESLHMYIYRPWHYFIWSFHYLLQLGPP